MAVRNLPRTIRSAEGREPHDSYGGWRNFLLNFCTRNLDVKGVAWFTAINSSYFIFPNGTLEETRGHTQTACMIKAIEAKGPARTLKHLTYRRKAIHEAAMNLGESLGALADLLHTLRTKKGVPYEDFPLPREP